MEISQENIEELAKRHSERKDYEVRTKVEVGRSEDGFFEGELNIVAIHKQRNHVVHIEVLVSDTSWEEQKAWLDDKFEMGRFYIFTEVFPELTWRTELFQWAVLSNSPKEQISGAKVITADELIRKIRHESDYDPAIGGLG